MELFTKKGKNRGRERLKIKTSPSSGIWRERLKTRLSLTGNIREGNTEFQSSPCGGEDTTPKGVNISPSATRRYGGRRGTGLKVARPRLPSPSP